MVNEFRDEYSYPQPKRESLDPQDERREDDK
jgi:hypothetical protein